jgi:two-component system, chemotaxis family, protein-glutamate methylesterase/glutaminase
MSEDEKIGAQIRVLVVDDSAFMRSALSRMIRSTSGLEVVGTAISGTEALAKIPELDPDVVTLDVEMPGLDGLATLRQIMQRFPRPVIMVSAVTERNAGITLEALSAGAFDCVPKQLSSNSLEIAHIRSDLIAKIYAAGHARIRKEQPPSRKPPQRIGVEPQSAQIEPAVVAIGTSTGGPKALEQILPIFPYNLPLPILIVQHMPVGFTAKFAERLNGLCSIEVREASDGEMIRDGTAYICPAGIHMRVQRRVCDARPVIALDSNFQRALHVPSVDVLMKSVAATFRSRALGVIMTGMGCDGAEGMRAIYSEGGITIGQDEASCAVYGMPRACADQGVLTRIVPLIEIPGQILRTVRQRKPA